MSKPAPRQNFLQTFLIVTVLYMGFMLIFNRSQANPATDKKTSADIYQELFDHDALMQETQLSKEVSLYKDKLKEAVQAKTLTQAEADEKEFKGDVLLADAQLKGAILRQKRSP